MEKKCGNVIELTEVLGLLHGLKAFAKALLLHSLSLLIHFRKQRFFTVLKVLHAAIRLYSHDLLPAELGTGNH